MMGLKAKVKRKLNSRDGFSLTELLLATIILLLVSLIVASGIPVAREAYEKVVLKANAEVFLSTTISTLRNELGMAQDATPIDSVTINYTEEGTDHTATASNAIIYYNINRQSYSAIFKSTDSHGKNSVFLQRYTKYDPVKKATGDSGMGVNSSREMILFISEKDANKGLYLTYDSVSCTDGVVVFSKLRVIQGEKVLAERPTLSIRMISE